MAITFNAPHKRPGLRLCSFNLSKQMIGELNAYSTRVGTSKSELVRLALRELLDKHKASPGEQEQEERPEEEIAA